MVEPLRDYSPEVVDHPRELYANARIEEGHDIDSLTDEQIVSIYQRDGYIAIHNVYSPVEVQSGLDGLEDIVRGKVKMPNLIMVENKAADRWASASEEERADIVRKIGLGYTQFEPRLKAFCEHVRLLRIISLLMGGQCPQMFQDMALIKPPKIGREQPWHQDQAYFDYALETPVVGAWIALDEATLENGCMHVLPGDLSPRWHYNVRDWQICDAEMMNKPCVAVPLRPGGVLFFSGRLPHGTPTNHSSLRRRAVQFHYAPEGAKKLEHRSHLKFFGGRDNNVEC